MKFHESKRVSEDGKQRVALVDIDETICFYSEKRQYNLSEPSYENISKINRLYNEGWKIIYWTARGAVSGVDYTEHTKSAKIMGLQIPRISYWNESCPQTTF